MVRGVIEVLPMVTTSQTFPKSKAYITGHTSIYFSARIKPPARVNNTFPQLGPGWFIPIILMSSHSVYVNIFTYYANIDIFHRSDTINFHEPALISAI